MRRGAELRGRDHVGHRRQLRLPHRVDERELDLDPAVALRTHRADHHRVGAARAKVRGADVLGAIRPRRDAGGIDHPEEAAAGQVGADDAGDAERKRGLVVERHDRDRDRRAGAADDLDGELGARGTRRQKCNCDKREEEASDAKQMDPR